MYIDVEKIGGSKQGLVSDVRNWKNDYQGVRLWHATRVKDINCIKTKGLILPNKDDLDNRLLSWIKEEKSWYSREVETIIKNHPFRKSGTNCLYAVLDKDNFSDLEGENYKKYGSEYWQMLMGVLKGKGYGKGKDELLDYGRSCILALDLKWSDLDPQEAGFIVQNLNEGNFHSSATAIFRNVSPQKISHIEMCE